MKLYDDVGLLLKRLWSVRMAAIGVVWAAAGTYWVTAPESWRPDLSEGVRWIIGFIGIGLAAAPGFAALFEQPKLQAELEARKSKP